MKDHFSVILNGGAGPLTSEMVFVYDQVRKVIFVRHDGEDLRIIWGGLELPALPLHDEDDLVRFLEYLAEIYRLDIDEEQDILIPGLLIFGLEARK